MEFKKLFYLIALLLFVGNSYAGTISSQHFNSWTDDQSYTWTSGYAWPSIVSEGTTPDSPTSVRFTFNSGMEGGNAPADIRHEKLGGQTELWWEYWFKFSAGFEYHPVGVKHIYIKLAPSGSQEDSFVAYDTPYGGLIYLTQTFNGTYNKTWYPNVNSSHTVTDKWYRVKVHNIINTPGTHDGVLQVWLDDGTGYKLTHDYNNVWYRSGGNNNTFWRFMIVPVWGGDSGVIKKQTDFLFFDYVNITGESLGIDPSYPIVLKVPVPPSNIQIK